MNIQFYISVEGVFSKGIRDEDETTIVENKRLPF